MLALLNSGAASVGHRSINFINYFLILDDVIVLLQQYTFRVCFWAVTGMMVLLQARAENLILPTVTIIGLQFQNVWFYLV